MQPVYTLECAIYILNTAKRKSLTVQKNKFDTSRLSNTNDDGLSGSISSLSSDHPCMKLVGEIRWPGAEEIEKTLEICCHVSCPS